MMGEDEDGGNGGHVLCFFSFLKFFLSCLNETELRVGMGRW